MKHGYCSQNKTEGFFPVPEDPKRCPLMMIGTNGKERNCIRGMCAMYDSKQDCCGILGRKGTK